MHFFLTLALGIVAALWALAFLDLVRGIRGIPAVESIGSAADADCPSISILFAARDEAEKLPGALETMLALDYPHYEVIAVDDRSGDSTGSMLDRAAEQHSQLKVVHVGSLPTGWLGKPHALQQAYEDSTGEWLVFTDADVHFQPDALRRAIALADAKSWEHLTLMCEMKLFTPGEKIAVAFFGTAFLLATRPWKTKNPECGNYMGVGAFQLIRRSAYEKLGTHRRLAMEVIDDMKLGKLAKESGVRSGVAISRSAVSIYWHTGLPNIIRGTTKNLFASSGYRTWLVPVQILAILAMFILPLVALPFVHGVSLALALVSVILPLGIAIGAARYVNISPLYALAYPVGALIFAWMVLRSAIVTLWQGGIVWRGTFYPLDELKRGMV